MTLPEYRRSYILQEIENQGSVTILGLADSLQVSNMTIRRDLDELEKEGLVRRVHGGAVSARGRSYEPPYMLRVTHAQRAKEAIGQIAADMVVDGDCIALDIGSTTEEIAKRLIGRRNLTIITTSIRIANIFLNQPDIRLILPGGIVRPEEASLIGELTHEALNGLFVDRLFLAVAGVDGQSGLSEYNWDDALVKKAMIRRAKKVILVADKSKCGKVAFAHVGDLKEIHTWVTDELPPQALLEKCNEAKIRVVVAQEMLNAEKI